VRRGWNASARLQFRPRGHTLDEKHLVILLNVAWNSRCNFLLLPSNSSRVRGGFSREYFTSTFLRRPNGGPMPQHSLPGCHRKPEAVISSSIGDLGFHRLPHQNRLVPREFGCPGTFPEPSRWRSRRSTQCPLGGLVNAGVLPRARLQALLKPATLRGIDDVHVTRPEGRAIGASSDAIKRFL